MKKYIAMMITTLLLAGCAGGNADPSPSQTVSETPQSTVSAPSTEAETSPSSSVSVGKDDGSGLPAFDTLDIYANKVNSGILADKKLTMVNFWGTYCGPCIQEMPDLAALADNMPEGSQLLGVVIDAVDEKTISAAHKIVEEAGATNYPHIMLDEPLYNYMMKIRAVPTTIFFDSDGRQVGDIIEGINSEDQYRNEIETRLAGL